MGDVVVRCHIGHSDYEMIEFSRFSTGTSPVKRRCVVLHEPRAHVNVSLYAIIAD